MYFCEMALSLEEAHGWRGAYCGDPATHILSSRRINDTRVFNTPVCSKHGNHVAGPNSTWTWELCDIDSFPPEKILFAGSGETNGWIQRSAKARYDKDNS